MCVCVRFIILIVTEYEMISFQIIANLAWPNFVVAVDGGVAFQVGLELKIVLVFYSLFLTFVLEKIIIIKLNWIEFKNFCPTIFEPFECSLQIKKIPELIILICSSLFRRKTKYELTIWYSIAF